MYKKQKGEAMVTPPLSLRFPCACGLTTPASYLYRPGPASPYYHDSHPILSFRTTVRNLVHDIARPPSHKISPYGRNDKETSAK